MCYVARTKIKKTQKPYRCEWCWQIIEQGESCYRDRGLDDGQWFVARLHIECGDFGTDELDHCETYIPGSGERPIVPQQAVEI